MRFLDARIHGVLDLVVVALFALGPFLFGLGIGGSPATIAWILAAVHLALSLLTRYPLGIRKVIPFAAHGIVELVVGVFLLILPSLEGYGPGSPARRFYLIMGAIILIIWALTAYRAADRVAD